MAYNSTTGWDDPTSLGDSPLMSQKALPGMMPSRAFTLFSMLRRRRSFLMPSAGLWLWKR